MRYLACFFLIFSSTLMAYELVIVQTISDSGNTFITRTGKEDGVLVGKMSTFTSENVSVIAKAVEVTREFAQWRILNRRSAVPFKKGQVITMYDATEYLWALSPEEVKSKYIKSEVFAPRFSIEASFSFFTGLSASVSGAPDDPEQRGGLYFEGMLQQELNKAFAVAGGIRYQQERINVPAATLTTSQLLGIGELRYYFKRIPKFHNSRFGLALGAGFGQSVTSTSGQSSSGTVSLLPTTKIFLNIPMSKKSEFVISTAFESTRTQESFEDGNSQSTNEDNLTYGVAYRRYLDI